MSDDHDNVIHLSFDKDGNVRRRKAPGGGGRPPGDGPSEPRRNDDPLADLYGRREVARLFGLGESRLAYWDRSGFIKPSGRSGKRRYYTFQDLISIRAAKGLLDEGVPLRRVRKSVEALRSTLPKVVRPLNELRVMADGPTVLVRDRDGSFEPTTGQLVLDFRVEELREDVVRVLRARQPDPRKRRTAYEHYLEGCRLDEDEATLDQAEEAYLRALQLDPSLANAITNLGNVRFRRGQVDEAQKLYHQALKVDPQQPEAAYNIGFLAYDAGELAEAVRWFERALQHDWAFADAHFNVAMAYQELGRPGEARPHWEQYLRLEPKSPWAEVARRHLDA
ncbi:MAG: tetratricopeptide repeat protein [Myxococcota bacterium]